MTSREQLAWAVLAAPALVAVLLILVPRRLVTPLAVVGAFVTAGLGLALAVLAFGSLSDPIVGKWIVVDAAGGLLVVVVAVVGFATVVVSQPLADSESRMIS